MIMYDHYQWINKNEGHIQIYTLLNTFQLLRPRVKSSFRYIKPPNM